MCGIVAYTGIAHPRRGTHGEQNYINAHSRLSFPDAIALADNDMPVIFIATDKSTYEKVVSSVQEVKTRHGRIISVETEGGVFLQRWNNI